MGQIMHRGQKVGDVQADLLAQFGKDSDNLPLFRSFEFSDAIIGFDNRGRLNENGLSGSTLIVYDTLNLAFHGRSYGNYQAPIAQRGAYVAIYVAVFLSIADNRAQVMGNTSDRHFRLMANGEQFGRSGVFYFSIFIQHLVYPTNDIRKGHDAGCHFGQSGIGIGVLVVVFAKERCECVNGHQGPFQVKQFQLFQMRIFGLNT